MRHPHVLIRWLCFFALCLLQAFPCPGRAGNLTAVPVWLPASPASVPVVMALETLPWAQARVFKSHIKAHAMFLRGEIPLLVTGLSVGKGFFDRGVKIRLVNSFVRGMTYLVTDREITGLSDLAGTPLALPFKGSPIDEVTRVFVEKEGLVWNQDIPVVYRKFESCVAQMRLGRIHAAALPEPWASMVTGGGGHFSALSYKALWARYTDISSGFPQVGLFANPAWANAHPGWIAQLNTAIADAVEKVRKAPGAAAISLARYTSFSEETLKIALGRIAFCPMTGQALKADVNAYYRIIGQPPDGHFDAFF